LRKAGGEAWEEEVAPRQPIVLKGGEKGERKTRRGGGNGGGCWTVSPFVAGEKKLEKKK